ncbi:hypothetical protein LDO32_01390 [Luteimonas sp. Y-2-2-4F]|nr:hypothetical protein [Luteimonas sp. Y-2-2-4F]MCD9030388.1 hypothetical protein [Luteimonas sp. Y-2-2-4F]
MNNRNAPLDAIPGPQLCALYARELRDLYPDRSWQELEPILYRLWGGERAGDRWREVCARVQAFWRNG